MGYLMEHSLDVRQIAARVVLPEHGGVVTFVGAVRNHHAGRRRSPPGVQCLRPDG